MSELTRFEIIDHTTPVEEGGGRRVIVSPGDPVSIMVSAQDEGRTLKVFLANTEGENDG